MCVFGWCLSPKKKKKNCIWVVITASGCGVMLNQLFILHFLLLSIIDSFCSCSIPAEAHDGDDRIPRLPPQTWAHRSRIWGESAPYFTLRCPVILTTHNTHQSHFLAPPHSLSVSLSGIILHQALQCILRDCIRVEQKYIMHRSKWSQHTLMRLLK